MKKTFQLRIDGKNRDRVIEATKHEIRRYMQRERRKPLPEGAAAWYFDCRFGLHAQEAAEAHPARLNALIDAAATAGADSVYVEIVARPAAHKAASAAASEALPDAGLAQLQS